MTTTRERSSEDRGEIINPVYDTVERCYTSEERMVHAVVNLYLASPTPLSHFLLTSSSNRVVAVHDRHRLVFIPLLSSFSTFVRD